MRDTDKKLMYRGLILLAISLPLFFLGPYLLTLAFLNKDTPFMYVFLPFGVIAAFGAVVLAFKGLNTLLKSFKF